MLNVISLGAGVQSSTLALMAAKGEITPMPDFAVFADTQVEPESVYKWLDWLEKELPFPVFRVSKGNLAEDGLEVKLSKRSGKQYLKTLIPLYTKEIVKEIVQPVLNWGLPENETEEISLEFAQQKGRKGILPRKCTSDYKIEIIHRFIKTNNLPKKFKKDEIQVIQWMGISIDEASRMKESRKEWIQNYYPLIDLGMSRTGCLEWMEKNHYPIPPRSACVFCPFHSDEEWIRLKTEEPKEFEIAVNWEKRVQQIINITELTLKSQVFLHNSLVPLDQVEFNKSANKLKRNNECEGICGI